MYAIYVGNEILHYPMLADSGRVVISPVLHEELNTHGWLRFTIAPTNPLYGTLTPRKTKVMVLSDTKNRKPWFGRVMQLDKNWNNCYVVYCEGELGCLCDSIYRPFGFEGDISDLLADLIRVYNGSNTGGYVFALGNVSVTDPNQNIVRSSSRPDTVWDVMSEKFPKSSLGGYIMPRYDAETDTHYIDYLALDENDAFAHESTQIVKFGRNLLDFSQHVDADDVITVLIPYGATIDSSDPAYIQNVPTTNPPTQWTGNRITVKDVNNNKDYIINETGRTIWGRVVGTKTWDDVTVPANLLTKATAWLAEQIASSITLEISAVDLSFIDVDVEQIQVGDYVTVQSMPHDINVKLLCTRTETHLTELEDSAIILGAGIKALTDLQTEEVEQI